MRLWANIYVASAEVQRGLLSINAQAVIQGFWFSLRSQECYCHVICKTYLKFLFYVLVSFFTS